MTQDPALAPPLPANFFGVDSRHLDRTRAKASALVLNAKQIGKYLIKPCKSATAVFYVKENFISGDARMRAKPEGGYPYNYLKMIDEVFGPESNTIEVCCRHVNGRNKGGNCLTVDINPLCNPDLVTDGQKLDGIPSNSFDRWRCDPPYNLDTTKEMYGTELPNPYRLLEAGGRVCKKGALLFLLLDRMYNKCPNNMKWIGRVELSALPNNELRVLNLFLKTGIEEQLKHVPKRKSKNQGLLDYTMVT